MGTPLCAPAMLALVGAVSVDGSGIMAGPTRLELATSGVTGRRSNQLNYDPAWSGIRAFMGII